MSVAQAESSCVLISLSTVGSKLTVFEPSAETVNDVVEMREDAVARQAAVWVTDTV